MDICSNIRLSVIIPAYNAEITIERCLQSILSCNIPDIEVLVVDDGSTDNTLGKLRDFEKDSRVTIIHKENGGVSSARNNGLDIAKGKWITFVDADDYVTNELLSQQLEKDCDLYCFNWRYTTGEIEEHLKSAKYDSVDKNEFLNLHLVDYIFRTPWGKIFNAGIIRDNDIRFNGDYNIGEDNLFMLDYLCYCSTITTIESIGYVYLRPAKGKYPLLLEKATGYITLFMEKYDRLNVDCQSLLLLIELYYFMSLNDDSFGMRIKWERSSAVRYLQNRCWKKYDKREQIKKMFRRLLIKLGYE